MIKIDKEFEALIPPLSFDIAGNVIKGMSIPLTEDELNEKLEADAIGEELA